MLRTLTLIIGCILLAILVGVVAQVIVTASGETQIDWNDWRLTLPTGFLLLIITVLLVVVVLFDRLVQFIASIPHRLQNVWDARRVRAGRRALALGMAAAAAGDGDETMTHAKKAMGYLGRDTMTDLLMAQASALEGDTQSARRYFQALTDDKDTAYFGHVGLMRLAVAGGKDSLALKEGREALRLKSASPSIAQAVFVLEAKTGNWQEAAKALTVATKHGRHGRGNKKQLGSGFDFGGAEAVVNYETSKQQSDTPSKQRFLLRALRADAGFIPAALALAECYGELNQKRKAIAILEKTFTHTPHPHLASRLMQAWDKPPASNLAQLIRLVEKGGDKAEALFIAADIAYQQSLWAEAMRLITRIPEDKRDSRVWRLLADLSAHAPSQHQSQQTASQTAQKIAWPDREASLQQAAIAPRPPSWLCANCNSHYVTWQPICDTCKSFARIRWM